jgi:hypothetical protein
MTFANGFARGIALTALALGSLGVASAQNGSNYHVLSNSVETAFLGIGAGGTQTALDGLGMWIPGEDCRGSLLVDPDGGGALLPQFCYRQVGFRETWCIFTPGVISGLIERQFPGLYMIELDGLNANNNVVFLRPVCTTPITASFLAYGTGPSSTASFVLAAVSALSQTVLLPNNNLVSTGTPVGTATIVALAQVPPSAIASGCYVTTFFWAGSSIPYLDNIDALWHYTVNSPDLNQYWAFSTDEMNLTRSNTLVTDAGITALFAFDSVLDYSTSWMTREAQTTAVLGPHGIGQDNSYYLTTENMAGGGGPNFGFDVGRGSHAISFSGLGGVKVAPGLGGLGNGAQDPAYDLTPPTTKTMGFVTWDNKANSSLAGVGSTRVPWLGIDLSQIGGGSPETDPDIKKLGGTVRLPVIGTGFIQPVTSLALSIFGHVTKVAPSGWPDPEEGAGLPSGAAGVAPVAGGSIQFNVGPFVAKVPCTGAIPLNITYGTTGRHHTPPPTLTWDPSIADVSGTKEIYLWK